MTPTLLAVDHVYRHEEAFQYSSHVVNRQQGVMNETPTLLNNWRIKTQLVQ